MPNNNGVTILDISRYNSPSSDNSLGFCLPMFEGIFLISCESASYIDMPPYYGDDISLGFWESLNLDFGAPTSVVSIVCIGSSLTAGYGGGGIDWPQVWSSFTGHYIINKGVSGETSTQLLARFNSDVISLNPDYCVIEVGNTDAYSGVPLQTCKDNISAMINLCVANNIQPRIVHYIQRDNQMELSISSGAFPSYNKSYIVQYLEDIWTYIQNLGYPCILLNEATDVDENNADMNYFYNTANDYVHPNASGYSRWAKDIWLNFIDISSSHDDDNLVYTLHDNWKYKYYYSQKKFVILDAGGNTVIEKSNVINISQFPIDFSVHKSHQFEIIIRESSSDSFFYIPAVLVKKIYGESPIINSDRTFVINNSYLYNSVNGFSNGLCTNYQRIEQIYDDSFMKSVINPVYKIFKQPEIHGVQGSIDSIFMDKCSPTSQVYEDNFMPFYAIKKQITFKSCMLKYSLLLAIMGLTMFPMLEPILRNDETQNNRPLYEPWLIWGVMKYLGNHEFGGPFYPWDDEDTPNIDVLDGISPNWSY